MEFRNSPYNNDLKSKKKFGEYYTPEYITDYICRNTIISALSGKNLSDVDLLLSEFRNTPQILIEKINNLKILDPSCGDGAFLVKSFEILFEILKKTNFLIENKPILNESSKNFAESILRNNLFGIDINPNSIKIAIDTLIEKSSSFDINSSVYNSLSGNIICGDALFDKKIMYLNDFDVLVGNPPYVDIKEMDQNIVKILFSKFSCVENRANLYAAFIELSVKNLLRDGGFLGFIIPNSLLYNSTYKKIRKLILDKTIVFSIVRLPDKIFSSAHVETAIILLRNGKINENGQNQEYKISNLPSIQSDLITALIYPRNQSINIIDINNCLDVRKIKRDYWYEKPYFRFRLIDKKTHDILKKIENDSVNLGGKTGGICDFSLGITPYDKYKGHTKIQIENKIFHSNKKLDDTYKPLLSGSNIVRYGVFWDRDKYIKYGKWLGASRESRFFTKPHIIVRQIISGKPPRIYAAYTEDELYNTQIGFNIIIKTDQPFSVKLKYILAIINSKLMNFYHKFKFLDETKNIFQKILIENAKNFPIKVIDSETQRELSELTDSLTFLVKQNYNLQNNVESSAKIEFRNLILKIKELDDKIDNMIYNIYKLSSDEILFIENSLKRS